MPCNCRQSFCPECGPGVEAVYTNDAFRTGVRRAEAAEHRRAAAEYLDAELKHRAEKAEARVRELTTALDQVQRAEQIWNRTLALRKRAEKAEATLQQAREALIDRHSGRPQCRGCHEYLDKSQRRHTETCWAAQALEGGTDE